VTRKSLDDLERLLCTAPATPPGHGRTSHHIPTPSPYPDPSPSDQAYSTDPNARMTRSSRPVLRLGRDHVMAETTTPAPAQGDALTWSHYPGVLRITPAVPPRELGTGGQRTLL